MGNIRTPEQWTEFWKEVRKKFQPIVDKISHDTSVAINKAVQEVDTPDMPYKAQWVLEEVVESLTSRI